MTQKDFDVLFHVPYNADQIKKEDIDWLKSFESILKVSLKQIIKQDIKIRNNITNQLNDTSDLSENIVLQFLINNDYQQEKCVQSVQENKQLSLIFQVICKPNIDQTQIPSYSHIKNYELYDNSIKANNILDINNLNNDIWLKILDITYEIRDYSAEKTEHSENNNKIFIAETSNDQLNSRKNLIREFNHLGYHVVPDENLPGNILTFSEKASDYMQDAMMSVHIIGNEYAPLIENMEVSKVELQNDIFSEVVASNPSIKRYVWISPNIKPKSEKQKQYIESFKRNIELLVNTEIIQTPLEVFKTILKENLNISDRNTQESLIEQKAKCAYVIYTEDASKKADEIKHELSKQNIQVLNSSTTGNKMNLIQEHKKNLVKSDVLVIIYSSDNEQWLHSKLSDVMKSPGFGKKNTYNLKLLLVDTDKKPKNILKIKNLEIIDVQDKSITEVLSSRIEKIK